MTARVSHTTQSHQSQQGTNETTLSKAAAQLGQSFDMLCLEQRQQPEARNSDYVEAAAMPADASPAKPQPELIQEQPYVMQYDVYKLPLTLLDWRRAPINIDGTAK